MKWDYQVLKKRWWTYVCWLWIPRKQRAGDIIQLVPELQTTLKASQYNENSTVQQYMGNHQLFRTDIYCIALLCMQNIQCVTELTTALFPTMLSSDLVISNGKFPRQLNEGRSHCYTLVVNRLNWLHCKITNDCASSVYNTVMWVTAFKLSPLHAFGNLLTVILTKLFIWHS